MRYHRIAVAALALAVCVSPLWARAQSDAEPTESTSKDTESKPESSEPAQASVPSASEAPTPLTLRPNHPATPLEFSGDSSRSTLIWKLLALVAVVGAVVWSLRRRASSRLVNTELSIVRRTSIGLRSELIVVHVEGQRLLLGVTAHSIQTLAVLDGDDSLADSPLGTDSPTLGTKFGAMLDAVERTPNDPSSKTARSKPDDELVPGQARGLTGLRRRG